MGREDRASLAAAATGRDRLCAGSWASSGHLLVWAGLFLLLSKAGPAQVPPQGAACSRRSGSAGQEREQQGCKKREGEKTKRKS